MLEMNMIRDYVFTVAMIILVLQALDHSRSLQCILQKSTTDCMIQFFTCVGFSPIEASMTSTLSC